MKVGVIGTGYVGLVKGVVLADQGNDVICVDNDPHKVAKLREGIPPIYEPGIEEMLPPPVIEAPPVYEGPERRSGIDRRILTSEQRHPDRRSFGRRASDLPTWGVK